MKPHVQNPKIFTPPQRDFQTGGFTPLSRRRSQFSRVRSKTSGFVSIDDHINEVFESITADELLSLSVGALADKFSCSRRHLNRLFHMQFGLSLASLRMEMRLLKAVTLLRNQDVKIINVAENCGFNHLGLFNTCFKRRFGVTPGQWRNSNSEAKSLDSTTPIKNLCLLHATGLCPWLGEHKARFRGSQPGQIGTSQSPLPTKNQAARRGLGIPGGKRKSGARPEQ